MQTAEHILLVRPSRFVFNQQTAASNVFQQASAAADETVSSAATEEFDVFTEKLRSNGINVIVIEDTAFPVKPDAVFPNNWVSFHHDGTVILYPMFAPNRRHERRMDIIEKLKERFYVKSILDLTNYENEGKFLEGTGSIIFDHIHKISYACLSPRTNKQLFLEVSEQLGYRPVYFEAYDRGGTEIYHTNVMMCVAEKFALVCLESISDKKKKQQVFDSLASTGHMVIEISLTQALAFAGNMLAVKNKQGEDILVMSQSAFDSLTDVQRSNISKNCKMLPVPIKTIETIGGGSARCMMAEVFLPLKNS